MSATILHCKEILTIAGAFYELRRDPVNGQSRRETDGALKTNIESISSMESYQHSASEPPSKRNSWGRSFSRLHLGFLVLGLLALAVPHFYGQQQPSSPGAPPKEMAVYLLIGGSNMAGRAEIPADAEAVLDRCYLLNDQNQWEPARNPLNRYSAISKDATLQKLGPGYAFAKKMLERDKTATIGLIVNALDEDAKIKTWLGKSESYWSARRRAKAALRDGMVKGVLWHQGESDHNAPESYVESLQAVISNVRSDASDFSLPFVTAQVPGAPEINAQLGRLPERTHAIAVVSTDDLTLTEDKYFDAKSQLLLGERYAEQMIRLQAARPASAKPPSDIKFIDPHVHAMAVSPTGLHAVAKWMEKRNVERCIISPLSHKGSRPQNEEERQTMLANLRPYKGRIDHMCIIEPGEVQTVDEAVAILKREIADGAVGFGEHYGVDLMFDDPKNLMLYEACEKVGLPVMFHIDQNKNMVEPGMARVDRVLKMFPKCKVVAHAYWWRQLKQGDRQLQEHPNLYADMSGKVVFQELNRDRKYAREFLIRNQDKLLWATDEGWWSFNDTSGQTDDCYTFLEELDLPAEVRHKIYRGNSEKVYGLKK